MHTPVREPYEEIRKLRNEFLASLNHEIRTPLSGILGMMDLLEESGLAAEQREYVGAARMCAEELLRHLNAALEYSALASGHLALSESEFNLPECLRTTVELYRPKAQSRNLRLSLLLETGMPEGAVGDPARIHEILAHLVDNAIKFTSEGEIEVSAGAAERRGGCFRLVIAVRDTGIGIPEEHRKEIFESFQQIDTGLARRYDGLGLGLALVSQLVRLMHGTISVESTPGQGSTFQLSIPLRLVAEPPAATQTDRTGRVLIVEDNELGVRIVCHLLCRAGFEVDAALSGEAGIAAAAEKVYDLVLMDIEMPGMSGLEATRKIRELPAYAAVPIVALTAHADGESRAECLAHGMQGFLSKPIRAQELLSAVRRFLHCSG